MKTRYAQENKTEREASDTSVIRKMMEARSATVHDLPNEAVNKKHYELTELADELLNSLTTIIPLRIDQEPLTPQTLALICSALTELTTKLWLIAMHRLADLIEYTQTHDARFANKAGTTIAWATYNSPFSFGLQVDKFVPSVAEAVMTIVDGLSQRKAKREQLEINNQTTAQKIKEAEEALKQQQEMAELERQKMELGLEKLRLENQKERQAFVEQRLESRTKQITAALELAGKAIDIVYPNGDPEMRPVFMQILVNNILQIDSVEGLQLALPEQSNVKPPTKEEA